VTQDNDKGPTLGAAAAAAQAARDARRAEALRANLRRRKVQERGREQEPPAEGAPADPDNLFQHISD
jgi:hypothetical protein